MVNGLNRKIEFDRTVAFESQELQVPDVPPAGDIAAYGVLFYTLGKLVAELDLGPFEWRALETKMSDGIGSRDICKAVTGKVWNRWYPGALPSDDAVVPRQLVIMVHKALAAIKLQYESEEARRVVTKRAEEGFEAVRENSKKLRT